MKRWEAGELGCSQLAVQLRLQIAKIEPGETLEVISRNAGSATDVPAWCRVTGHTLVSAQPPVFVIRRKTV